MDIKSKTLERVILALSDQQLVARLAVLVTGFAKSCIISYWELQIVITFATGIVSA